MTGIQLLIMVLVQMYFLDFQKAFDTVPNCRLIKKLDAYRIKGSLLLWIKDFLSEHTQQVV